MHGFINGLNEDDVTCTILPSRKRPVYHWIDYEDKFGFTDMEIIEDKKRASSYILKYISKDMSRSVNEINAQSYYCSKGLNKAQVVKRGRCIEEYMPTYTYALDNQVVYSEKWLDNQIEAERLINDNMTTDTWQDATNNKVDWGTIPDENIKKKAIVEEKGGRIKRKKIKKNKDIDGQVELLV